ncbi:MAG: hypothetical protein K8H74_10430 [Notoacmeibacter sp.]|nr:hypothetical protein [Notoacmeibacter sp.]
MEYPSYLSRIPIEPTMATRREVGTLCQAWSFLDLVSDILLYGLTNPSDEVISILSEKMEMRSKWENIFKLAKDKLSASDLAELKTIKKLIETVASDRNIIIHGEVSADIAAFPAQAFWTIWKGANAGKRFPISTEAARIVCENVQYVANSVVDLNKKLGFGTRKTHGEVVKDWPIPL